MCIAILKPKGARKITEEEFGECWTTNKDGFGCMFQIKEKGKMKVKYWKTMDKEQAFAFFNDVQSRENIGDIGFHFRIATHGKTDINMCHPFNAWHWFMMMHNGMLWLKDPFGEKSDTCLLAEMLATKEFNWWADSKRITDLSEFARWSKLVFMDSTQSFIINEKSGHWSDGIWWSNYSYVKYTAPKKTETTKYKNWNDPYKGTTDNRSLILPVTVISPEEQKRRDDQIKEIQEWTQYKSSIQGLLSREQREDLNTITMDETNWLWLCFTWKDNITLEEKKSKIHEFYEYVMTDVRSFPNFKDGKNIADFA